MESKELVALRNQLQASRLALDAYINFTYDREDFDESKMHDPAARKLSDLEMILSADPNNDSGYIASELRYQQDRIESSKRSK